MDGQTYFEPHFKPDLNVDLLCSVNYFCHLVVVKRQLLEQAGNLNGEYNGAQDYDFVLRCVEKNRCSVSYSEDIVSLAGTYGFNGRKSGK